MANKLESDFSLSTDQVSQFFILPHSVALESYVKAFQYKVLNSILYTNTKLCKIGFKGPLHGEFQPGLKFEIVVKSGRPPSCFAENTITEHAQAHFSARAEILMRLHEVFLNFSPG